MESERLAEQLTEIRDRLREQSKTEAARAKELAILRSEVDSMKGLVEKVADRVWRDNGHSLVTRMEVAAKEIEALKKKVASVTLPRIAWWTVFGLVLVALGAIYGPDFVKGLIQQL